MTTGLVLEGGGMRGMFTAGVLDVFMEEGVEVDHAVGVSAGAAFGVNIKSRQPGRALRYNKRFCADPRYASLKNLLREGNLYSVDFAYREVPLVHDVFDAAALRENPLRFTAVCTDICTGEAVYHDIETGDEEDLDWIRASASIPLLARPVELAGRTLLDGGIAESIPMDWMIGHGYDRNIVVLTRPAGYRKEPNRLMPILRVALRGYPRLVELLANRHERYNACIERIAQLERAGRVFVIRPDTSVGVPLAVKDPEVLERIYQIGRRVAQGKMTDLKRYLSEAIF